MFNFLWSRNGKREHIHLCKWEIIAKPKSYGGWGVRNLYMFNRSLVVNTLWHCLIKDDIWHKVLKDKYLPHSTVVTWLRSAILRTHNTSNTWRILVKYLDLITHCLSWSPSSGHSIHIGEDEILGMGLNSILSPDLITTLKQQNIYFLYQEKGAGRLGAVLA